MTFTWSATPNVTSVVWYLNGAVGGAQTPDGTLSQGGVYTAPIHVPNPNTVTIYAEPSISGDNTQSNSITLTISPTVGVGISPAPVPPIPVGGSTTLTASVSNSTNQSVTWSMSPTFGTLTPSGNTATYTAPASLPSSWTGGPYPVTITATSVADNTETAQVIVNVHVTVTINSPPSSLPVNGTWQYTATVNGIGSAGQVIKWSTYTAQPNCMPNGAGQFPYNSDPTSDPSGFYIAPACVPGAPITITAISQFDSGENDTASLAISAGSSFTISPNPASVPVAGTQQFTATPTGGGTVAVNWQVNGITGGNATVGTINTSGLYTAPATFPTTITSGQYQVTITAVSQTDSNNTASAPANVHVTLAITPSIATMGAGANRLFTATVNGVGASHQAVNWSPGYVAGNGDCTGIGPGTFPDTSGLYIAPLCIPTDGITVTAISQFDTSQSHTANITLQPFDVVGTVTPSTAAAAKITCPTFTDGTAGATCYKLVASCDGVSDFNGYLKVNQPGATSLGTVIFTSGQGGGNALYDNDTSFFYPGSGGSTVNGGLAVVQGVLDAGFTTAQLSFGAPFDDSTTTGWLTGPGGVRRLACRYAAVAQWVYTYIHNSNAAAPMCATGNSGGAGAIAYSLTEYGQSNIFAMVEPTSGPPMARLDQACVATGPTQVFKCNPTDPGVQLPLNYALSEAEIVDPAYAQPYCSNAVNGTGTQAPAGLFLSDSVLGGIQPPPSGAPTYVNLLFGGEDTSSGVIQGLTWGQALGGLPQSQRACVEDAPHAIPAATTGDGAARILSDITTLCKLP